VFVGPGLATLLANFQVFLLALAGLFWFRDPLRWEIALSIPLAILGLGLLIGVDWSSLPKDYRTGIVLGLLTAFCYAAYILSLRASRVSEIGPSSLGIMALISFYCALLLAGLASLEKQSLAIPTWQDAGILIAYGIVAQVLGWMMISRGITKVGAAQTGLILLLQPTFSFVWDIAFFARRFTLLEGSGAVLALLAIYMGSLRR
jgi:drug/metabolite transporter (DMT)-like permease